MKDLQGMLEEKELQLTQLQKEIEALRLVVSMCSGRSETAPKLAAAIEPPKPVVAAAAPMPLASQPAIPDEAYMPAGILRGAATAAAYASPTPVGINGGTKRFP